MGVPPMKHGQDARATRAGKCFCRSARIPCALAALVCTVLTAQAFDLVRDGQVRAVAVVGENPAPTTLTAAGELTNYVYQITGARMRISAAPVEGLNSVMLGVDYKAARTDEICIRFRDKTTLELTGDMPRGTLYAVYELLEHFGCRFWAPGNETVPQTGTLTVPPECARVYAPPFVWRQAYGQSTSSDYKFAVKNRLNGTYWGHPRMPDEWGGKVQVDVGETLTLRWVKSKVFFKDHPEWYTWSEKENKRIPAQLCTSNPEALAQLDKEVLEYLREHPDTKTLSISGNDSDKYCRCEECKKVIEKEKANSALLMIAANRIGRLVARDYPDLRIVMLAYWASEKPPLTMTFEPNVTVCFAKLRDFATPIARNQHYMDNMLGWKKLSPNPLYIWDYNARFSNFILPSPAADTIGPNMRVYRDHGIAGMVAQLPWGSLADWVDLRCWLWGRTAWDPDVDSDRLIDEWIAGACGKGGPMMKSYWDLLLSLRKSIGPYGCGTEKWLTPQAILECHDLQQRAIAATAEGEPRTHAQVEKLSAAMLCAMVYRYKDLQAYAEAEKVEIPARDAIIDRLEELGKKYRCSTYREWDDYRNMIKKMRAGEI